MMYLSGVLLFCVLSATVFGVNSEWIQELVSSNGLDLGNGFSIHLDPLKRENSSFLENHALRFDYSGMGLSVEKASDKEAFQVSVYTDDREKGRGKPNPGMFIIPAILSFKATGVFLFAFLGTAVLVMKAIGLAKLAILISAGIWLSKYFVYKPHVEVEQYPAFHAQPVYLADFPSGGELSPRSASPIYTLYTIFWDFLYSVWSNDAPPSKSISDEVPDFINFYECINDLHDGKVTTSCNDDEDDDI